MNAVLEIEQLTVDLTVRGRRVHPVDGVSLQVAEGGTTALIGESGCGKTMTALAVMGLLPETAHISDGRIVVAGQDVTADADALRRLRQRTVAMVFQDPFAALNPVMSIGTQVAEVFRVLDHLSRSKARAQAIELLDRVGIPGASRRHRDPPNRFSGGMLQRAMIAMAVALRPRLLIADEATTALDVTVQAQILELLVDLKSETGMGLLLITHDLGVVASLADHVVLMYAGQVVEEAAAATFYDRPQHPYARALLDAIPSVRRPVQGVSPIVGMPPRLASLPDGCRFHPRCPYAVVDCRQQMPKLLPTSSGHAACLRLGELP